MINRTKQLVAGIVLCLATTMPAAADGLYTGLSAVLFNQSVTTPFGTGSGNSTGVMFQFGSNFNEYLGLEVRLGMTGKADLTQIGATQDGTMSSLLFRGRIPFDDTFRLYGLFGTSTGTVTAGGSLTGNTSRQGISYGGGIEMLAGQWSGSAEWLRYWQNVNLGTGIDSTIDGIALTIGYNF
jgi:hypothetical protein